MQVQMQTELTKEILSRLDILAAKLGTTGEKLWTVLVRQARVELYQSVLTAVLLGITAFVSFRVCRWCIHEAEESGCGGGDGYGVGATLAGLACAGFCIATIAYLEGLPTLLLNPEYWALKQILYAVGK
jgi:hypothetical protein